MSDTDRSAKRNRNHEYDLMMKFVIFLIHCETEKNWTRFDLTITLASTADFNYYFTVVDRNELRPRVGLP